MKLLRLSLFFCISLIQSSYSSDSNDKKALLEIKKSFNNPELLSSWDPKTDYCKDWTGVICKNRHVTYLSIFSGEISGQIPTQIGDLTHLKTLSFTRLTNLTGNIPRSITKLKNLQFLVLTHTKISGPIPDYISELKNLETIELTANKLTGPIPDWLSQLSKLRDIDLGYNKLTGTIPNSFGSFVRGLFIFSLSNNNLSGKIPESLSKVNIKIVDLSGNEFTGDGSMFFGRDKTTQRVDLSRNKFDFELSDYWI